ncbi:MAG: hypothetical protein WD336_11410, partial [Trueperaceae bacterium]
MSRLVARLVMRGVGTVHAAAPAKTNLGLRVAALRGDGFHEIDTLFVALDLHDDVTVTVRPAEDGLTRVTGSVRAGDGVEEAGLPPMNDANLAARAARAWTEASGEPLSVRIDLVKRIPVAAGLGGGSSDAAAVLRALHALRPTQVDLAGLAKRLGSDVPFFVAGHAAARGRGRGERLRAWTLPIRSLVLANDGTPVPVADAYRALTGFGPPIDWEAWTRTWTEGGAPRARN